MARVDTVFGFTALVATLLLAPSADATLMPGDLDDFEDGTLQGWQPPIANTRNVAGGPVGSTRALEIRPGSHLSAFDAGIDIQGAIDPAVTAIRVDMSRSFGTDPLEIRLVLFGPGTSNRWTSTTAQILPGNGLWDSYTFSILESELTRVLGGGSYDDLVGNLNRIMFRHDAGGPSAGGSAVALNADPFFIDNVLVIPEPGTALLLALGLGALGATGRAGRPRAGTSPGA